MALGVGICINNTKAVFEAIWGAIKRKPSEFVRTPKYGVSGKTRNDWKQREDPLVTQRLSVANAPPTLFTLKRLMVPIIEVAFGVYMSCFVFISLYYQFARGSVPFLLIFAGGYLYVGVSSLYVLWKMQQEADEAAEVTEALSL
jgi:hypothetical protein